MLPPPSRGEDRPRTIAEGNAATYSYAITNSSTASTDPVTITSVTDDVLGDLTAAAQAAWLGQGNSEADRACFGRHVYFHLRDAEIAQSGPVVNTVTVSASTTRINRPPEATPKRPTVTNVPPVVTVAKSGPSVIAEHRYLQLHDNQRQPRQHRSGDGHQCLRQCAGRPDGDGVRCVDRSRA